MTALPEHILEIAAKCGELLPVWKDISSIWTMPILHILGGMGNPRFNQIKRLAKGISATSLAERLRTFEGLGIVQRRVYAEVPTRVEYTLTARGRQLYDVLDALTDLIKEWVAEEPKLLEKPVIPAVRA